MTVPALCLDSLGGYVELAPAPPRSPDGGWAARSGEGRAHDFDREGGHAFEGSGEPALDRGGGLRPVIDRARVRLSEEGLNRLAAPLSLTLRLGAGQADLEAEIGGVRVSTTLTAAVGLTGRLRLEATGLRLLGWLPLPLNLVALALSRLQGQRGIYVVGPHSVELDLPELLNLLPVALDVRLSQVRLEPGCIELHCVPRGAAG